MRPRYAPGPGTTEMDANDPSLIIVEMDTSWVKKSKEGELQRRRDAPHVKKGNLQRASKNRDMRLLFCFFAQERKEKRQLRTK